eukprot:350753-Chlamydomonas_euryale.AAC.2
MSWGMHQVGAALFTMQREAKEGGGCGARRTLEAYQQRDGVVALGSGSFGVVAQNSLVKCTSCAPARLGGPAPFGGLHPDVAQHHLMPQRHLVAQHIFVAQHPLAKCKLAYALHGSNSLPGAMPHLGAGQAPFHPTPPGAMPHLGAGQAPFHPTPPGRFLPAPTSGTFP